MTVSFNSFEFAFSCISQLFEKGLDLCLPAKPWNPHESALWFLSPSGRCLLHSCFMSPGPGFISPLPFLCPINLECCTSVGNKHHSARLYGFSYISNLAIPANTWSGGGMALSLQLFCFMYFSCCCFCHFCCSVSCSFPLSLLPSLMPPTDAQLWIRNRWQVSIEFHGWCGHRILMIPLRDWNLWSFPVEGNLKDLSC